MISGPDNQVSAALVTNTMCSSEDPLIIDNGTTAERISITISGGNQAHQPRKLVLEKDFDWVIT